MRNPVFLVSLVLVFGCGAEGSPDSAEPEVDVPSATSALNTLGDGYNSNLEIPLVVIVSEHTYRGGTSRYIVDDQWNLGRIGMNDRISSISVYPGPSYDSWKARNGGAEPFVTLYSDWSYEGIQTRFYKGYYHSVPLNDQASSLRFNTFTGGYVPVANAQTPAWGPISKVIRLYSDEFLGGSARTFIGNADLSLAEFNDVTSSVEILRGPNYFGNLTSQLCEHSNGSNGWGSCVWVTGPRLYQLGFGFNDQASWLYY